ncbi:MAG TPA: biopolymer transporter ExbD [Verrucomicrobiae bacterium]|jgi:biopolymer transport protein ExbD
MRRFSQRNHLVTLSDINITPLLDLAFVLLIIFVITTPLLEQSIKLNLPGGGRDDKNPPPKEDRRTIEVSPEGYYIMDRRKVSLNEVEAALVQAYRANPKLAVVIRADRNDKFGRVSDVFDLCDKHGIQNVGYSTRKEK